MAFPRVSRFLPLLCWTVAFLALGGPLLVPGQTLAFRDSGHYYPPLMRLVQREWRHGVPLWNSFEERGRPLLADPTAAVLYPGQLIFLLPIEAESACELYLVAHLFIAALGIYCVGALWKWNSAANTLASLMYAFGGFVAFQLHNAPYLIGAAWLPWVVWGVERLVSNPLSLGHLLSCCLPLACIVLGGDIQTAYLSVPVFASRLLFDGLQNESSWRLNWRSILPSITRWMLVLALVVLMTAAQWLPTWSWARSSDRTSAVGQSHAQVRYDYSIGPWLWLEMVLPNIYGRVAPQSTRWIQALPAEGRAWTPSLYMSLVGIAAAWSAVRLWRHSPRIQWLAVVSFMGMMASMGRFGVGWILNESVTRFGWAKPGVEDAWGGLYWLISHGAPGFEVFRYPAKMWLWTSLGLSLLAGTGLARQTELLRARVPDVLTDCGALPLPRWFRRILVFAGLAIVSLSFTPCADFLSQLVPADQVFGPLNGEQVRKTWFVCGLHVTTVGLIGKVLELWMLRRGRAYEWTLVTFALVDLIVAHHQLIPVIRSSSSTETAPAMASANGLGALRYFRAPRVWYPESWQQATFTNRLSECVSWDRQTLRAKHHLDQNASALRSSTSFSSNSQMGFLHLVESLRAAKDPAWFDLLRAASCDIVVTTWEDAVQKDGTQPKDGRIELQRELYGSRVVYFRLNRPLPRAWLVREADWEQETNDIENRTVEQWAQRLGETWLSAKHLERYPYRATIHAAVQPQSLASTVESSSGNDNMSTRNASCHCTDDRGSRKSYTVQTTASCWLVINDSYAPGWQAHIIDQRNQIVSVPVYRANELMMAVPVGPGTNRIELFYRPQAWIWGITISVTTCSLIGLWGVVRLLRRTLSACRS